MNRKNFAPESVKHINHKRVGNQFHDMLFGNLAAVPKNMKDFKSKDKLIKIIGKDLLFDIYMYGQIKLTAGQNFVKEFLNNFSEKNIAKYGVTSDSKILDIKKLIPYISKAVFPDTDIQKEEIFKEIKRILGKENSKLPVKSFLVNGTQLNKLKNGNFFVKLGNKSYTIDLEKKIIVTNGTLSESEIVNKMNIKRLYINICEYSQPIDFPKDEAKKIYDSIIE